MPIDAELSQQLNMKLTPRTRYFLELATRLSGKTSRTEYIEEALLESFKRVSLRPIDEFDDLDTQPDNRTLKHPLAAQMDNLWSEYPIVRLQLMHAFQYGHLLSKEETSIWGYISRRRDLFIEPGKMNRKLITEQWQEIKSQALGEGGAK